MTSPHVRHPVNIPTNSVRYQYDRDRRTGFGCYFSERAIVALWQVSEPSEAVDQD